VGGGGGKVLQKFCFRTLIKEKSLKNGKGEIGKSRNFVVAPAKGGGKTIEGLVAGNRKKGMSWPSRIKYISGREDQKGDRTFKSQNENKKGV